MDEIEREALLSGEDDEDSPLEQEQADSTSTSTGGVSIPSPYSLSDKAKRLVRSWPVVELKELVKLSVPTILMLFFQQFVYISAVLFAGHISGTSLELDAASLAISVSNVTGYSIIIGLSSAADTLCPQSFGFKNYKRVGEVFQQGIWILLIAALPVAAVWINSESLLLLLQQPPCVVQQASLFLRIFIAILPALIVMVMMQKYLQAQSVVWVFALTGFIYNLFTVLFSALFIYGFHQGVYSISVALVLAAYIATVFLVAYVKGRGLHKLTWGGWSLRSLDNWWLFLKLGLPGFLMLAFEWWTFEISVLVSGSLGKTELGVNAILLQLLSLLFMLPLGTGTAASIRVGNELGSGNPQRAKRSGYTAVALQFSIVSCVVVVLGLSHNVVGQVFTDDPAVIQGTSYTMYAGITLIFFDQMQGTIGGVFRGAGLQVVAAVVNFIVYYVIGLPVGVCLAVLTDLGALGMWIGLAIGSVSQFSTYSVILLTLNWDKLAKKAMKNARSTSSHHYHRDAVEIPDGHRDAVEITDGHRDAVEITDGHRDAVEITDGHRDAVEITDGHRDACKALATHPHSSPNSNGDVALMSYKNTDQSLSSEEGVVTSTNNQSRPRARVLLCRGLVVLVGVCVVAVSGVLAGVFTHPELDSCNVPMSCCAVLNTTIDSWTISPSRTSSALLASSSCVCPSLTLSPTPLPHI